MDPLHIRHGIPETLHEKDKGSKELKKKKRKHHIHDNMIPKRTHFDSLSQFSSQNDVGAELPPRLPPPPHGGMFSHTPRNILLSIPGGQEATAAYPNFIQELSRVMGVPAGFDKIHGLGRSINYIFDNELTSLGPMNNQLGFTGHGLVQEPLGHLVVLNRNFKILENLYHKLQHLPDNLAPHEQDALHNLFRYLQSEHQGGGLSMPQDIYDSVINLTNMNYVRVDPYEEDIIAPRRFTGLSNGMSPNIINTPVVVPISSEAPHDASAAQAGLEISESKNNGNITENDPNSILSRLLEAISNLIDSKIRAYDTQNQVASATAANTKLHNAAAGESYTRSTGEHSKTNPGERLISDVMRSVGLGPDQTVGERVASAALVAKTGGQSLMVPLIKGVIDTIVDIPKWFSRQDHPYRDLFDDLKPFINPRTSSNVTLSHAYQEERANHYEHDAPAHSIYSSVFGITNVREHQTHPFRDPTSADLEGSIQDFTNESLSYYVNQNQYIYHTISRRVDRTSTHKP